MNKLHMVTLPRTAFAWLFLICASIGATIFSSATAQAVSTYYVRTDGGTADQCTGLANAPYPGSGNGQACAWSHPFIALPPTFAWNPRAARLHGGDTLIIGHGSYMMGVGAPGADACTPDSAFDCRLQNIPSGLSAAQPTRILGEGYDQGCPAAPELWGSERAYAVMQIAGQQGGTQASNIGVNCLELTDHSSCIYQHCNLGGCNPDQIDVCNSSGAPPWGPWARFGIVANDAYNIYLTDLNIHGLAGEGVRAGRLTNWIVNRVRIYANGFAGWDNDIGQGVDPTGNQGGMLFSQVEIAYNGCGERYPSGEIFGCWDQDEGGYGDGLGTGHTGGNWTFQDSYVHDNVSDGLDLLYADGTGSVTFRRVKAERNAGNQLKAAGNVLVENSVVISTCAEPWAVFPPNNYDGPQLNSSQYVGRYNMQLGGTCRAGGASISLQPLPNTNTVIRDNTMTGQGGCQIVWTVLDQDRHDTSATVLVANNAIIGNNSDWLYLATGGGNRLTCGYFPYNTDIQGTISNNFFWNIRNLDVNHCPAGNTCGRDAEHNTGGVYCSSTDLCAVGGPDPQVSSGALESFNPLPLPTSPLINAAPLSNSTSTDFRAEPRPALGGYDVGAIEYQGLDVEDPILVSGFDGS